MSELWEPETPTRPKRAERPASRWKNEYEALGSIRVTCNECGASRCYTRGERYMNCCHVYPTRDIAVTAANDFRDRRSAIMVPMMRRYVGPVEMR